MASSRPIWRQRIPSEGFSCGTRVVLPAVLKLTSVSRRRANAFPDGCPRRASGESLRSKEACCSCGFGQSVAGVAAVVEVGCESVGQGWLLRGQHGKSVGPGGPVSRGAGACCAAGTQASLTGSVAMVRAVVSVRRTSAPMVANLQNSSID